jgi:hypothetical protein
VDDALLIIETGRMKNTCGCAVMLDEVAGQDGADDALLIIERECAFARGLTHVQGYSNLCLGIPQLLVKL